MENQDISARPGTVDDVSTTSTEQTLDPTDVNILIGTFRNDSTNVDIQKIIRNEMQVEDLPIAKELAALRSECENTYLSTTFKTRREQEQSGFIRNSIHACIDTALDALKIVGHAGAMISLLGDALNNNGIQSIPAAAIDHGRGLLDRTLSIYSRSVQQARAGTDCLLHAIERNNNTKNNAAVRKAIEKYEGNYLRYKNGEIDIKKVAESHDQLVQEIEEAEPDETTEVRQEAKKSSILWKAALIIGAIIAAPLIIGGLVLILMNSSRQK